ncbi:MAG: hypothetical protein AB9922_02725 [Bacteroidales bacterium]
MNLVKTYLLTILSVICGLTSSNGQDSSMSLSSKTAQNTPAVVKSLLPKEFCLPLSDLVVGISDPGRDSVTGMREALLRAFMVAALKESVKVSMVSEYFSSAKGVSASQISRFEEMYNVECESSAGITLKPVYTFMLSGGETLLFAQIIKRDPSANSKSKYKLQCSLYHVENILERGQHIYKTTYRFYPQSGAGSKGDEEKYEIYSFNNLWYTVTGTFNGLQSVRPESKYFYSTERSSVSEQAAPDGSIGVSTVEGLWPAYIAALLWQIAGVLDYGNPAVSQVTDSYSKNIRNLNRSAECNIVKAEILRLLLFRERLYPIVKIEQLNLGEK